MSFAPERWTDDEQYASDEHEQYASDEHEQYASDEKMAFRPFSVGTRDCIGQK
jgi:hypothetical protein